MANITHQVTGLTQKRAGTTAGLFRFQGDESFSSTQPRTFAGALFAVRATGLMSGEGIGNLFVLSPHQADRGDDAAHYGALWTHVSCCQIRKAAARLRW
jgi:hypothetical protein